MEKRLLILAGGMSSRMKKAAENLDLDQKLIDQANSLTKGMISVGEAGRPLIDYQLYNAQQAGFKNIVLLLHPDDTNTRSYYTPEKWPGLSIQFATQYISPDRQKPAGTADAVSQALQQMSEWQQGRFVVCNSDNLYSTNALNQLWNSPYPNSLISYDTKGLAFPEERIRAFALIRQDENGFLLDIHEKPTEEEIAEATRLTGGIGVSMNLFSFLGEQIYPYLQATPFHPLRNEKELPTTVNMLAKNEKVYVIPVNENVPDLTRKEDIALVQQYLTKTYSTF